MNIIRKLKFFAVLINVILIMCGCWFIVNVFFDTSKQHKSGELRQTELLEKNLMDSLTACQNDLFMVQNDRERLKLMPDVRKDVIRLMIVMRDMEKDIGIKQDFSSDCVLFFTLASKIPIIQEFILPYKQQMFKDNCRVANNSQIIGLIEPMQIRFLQKKDLDFDAKSKWYKRIMMSIKYQLGKLFIKSKIQKSDLEIAIENKQYQVALDMLNIIDVRSDADIGLLYDELTTLNSMQRMINGVYEIIRNN